MEWPEGPVHSKPLAEPQPVARRASPRDLGIETMRCSIGSRTRVLGYYIPSRARVVWNSSGLWQHRIPGWPTGTHRGPRLKPHKRVRASGTPPGTPDPLGLYVEFLHPGAGDPRIRSPARSTYGLWSRQALGLAAEVAGLALHSDGWGHRTLDPSGGQIPTEDHRNGSRIRPKVVHQIWTWI